MKKTTSPFILALFAGVLMLSSACSKDNVEPRNPTAKNGVADATVLGPFTVNASLVKVQSAEKIFLYSVPGRAAGVYFCDVYRSSASVTLSQGQLMLFDTATGSSTPGYSNPTTQAIGTSSSQLGSTYTFATYSIVPLYNSIGQSVPFNPIPTNLNGNVFTYSVYQL